ncbi:uncharacterized protein LOC115624749 [Scaptodrosophila lebanonensis]|uniref:Ragulator complex protein LAMTOR1 n=1 Tax=Drosophila lebanonensis TaxID=7225 RepID=A0A6J2TK94_DROLE|nr:uncharacterized protein LOC115624749 [Scaptodrosophila lebanonensis]
MEYVRSIWDCLVSICSCLHCTEDISRTAQTETERTHLLANDQQNQSPALRRTNSDLNNDCSQSLPKKDDQDALSRLVQDTAINMINVGAMDSHHLEHQEYTDKIKLYTQRLHQQWNNIQHPGNVPKGLLKDMPNHQFYVYKPVYSEDTSQMKKFIGKCHIGVTDIKIEHKEAVAVVVPFRIP